MAGDAVKLARDDDFILTKLAVYRLIGTACSTVRFCPEDAKAKLPAAPTTVPIGLAAFEGPFRSIRRFAEQDHKNIAQ